MHRALPLLLLCFAVYAAEVDSPLSLAARLEARMAAGDGATQPDANAEVVRYAGTVDLSRGDWPEAFAARAGEAVCVAVSPFTGCYEFFDETGAVFWIVVPAFPTTENWVAPFRHAGEGAFPDDSLYAPWRLEDVWFLSHAESAKFAEFESHAESAENAEALVARHSSLVTRGAVGPAANLCVSDFSYTETNLCFTVAWPTNETLPQSVLDLYGSSNLASRAWTFLSSHPATNPPVSFVIARESLSWFIVPGPHVHDASCVSITNTVASPLDGTTIYTNTFWSCSTNRPPGECGFFRLGTRLDTDGDGLPDAAEILVHRTDPHCYDTDGDGAPDGVDPEVWALTHPMWATNYADADLFVAWLDGHSYNIGAVLRFDTLSASLEDPLSCRYVRLPPGVSVTCRLETDSNPFIVMMTHGGDLWSAPDTHTRPFWGRNILGTICSYWATGGTGEIAVPVFSVEPVLGGSGDRHVATNGSVCVHGGSPVQRYSWSVAPADIAAWRRPSATGDVRIDAEGPFIDVSEASGDRSGAFGFFPTNEIVDGAVLWGFLTNSLSAHLCDASPTNPFCSVCACYDPLDAELSVSKTLLTLKHDNQATVLVDRAGPWGDAPPECVIQIRRAGETNEWLTLGVESALDPWTARIAGHFELRGIAAVGDFAITTSVQQVEVQFPSGTQIAADEEFVSWAEWAWTLMTSEAEEPPHAHREYGFCVFLDTFNQEYDCSDIQHGPFVPPYGNGEIILDCDPATDPESPSPTAFGARYAVATFHTHPPATYAFEGLSRPAGPSGADVTNAVTRGMPSIVADYVPLEGNDGRIRSGHAIDAEHQRTLIPEPTRRSTP